MKKNEVMNLQKQIIKIDRGIQEIRKKLINIKVKQHNDNKKFEEAISQQSKDTRVMENILQQNKSKYNKQNQILMSLTNIVETHELKLKQSYKGSTPASEYTLHTDIDTYPILKSANKKKLHWNKFLTNLSNIKLESDRLNDILKNLEQC